MKDDTMREVAAKLVAKGKGILAADESDVTCGKRFDKYGIEKTTETRRTWRELLFTTPEIEKGLSGVILFDETIRQSSAGVPFPKLLADKGIIPGIKVDKGNGRVSEEDRQLLRADLPSLPQGVYTVEWKVLSVDGHGTAGRFTFTVR